MVLFVFLRGNNMAKVIRLSDRKPIPPKSMSDNYMGQRYTITYDTRARSWVWKVEFKRVYNMFGEMPTKEAAERQAQKKIYAMTMRQRMEEESE
jgi:hypothetical protein